MFYERTNPRYRECRVRFDDLSENYDVRTGTKGIGNYEITCFRTRRTFWPNFVEISYWYSPRWGNCRFEEVERREEKELGLFGDSRRRRISETSTTISLSWRTGQVQGVLWETLPRSEYTGRTLTSPEPREKRRKGRQTKRRKTNVA